MGYKGRLHKCRETHVSTKVGSDELSEKILSGEAAEGHVSWVMGENPEPLLGASGSQWTDKHVS